MTEKPRNWDKELEDIDRVIEKGGGQPGAPPGRAGTPLPGPAGTPARPPAPGPAGVAKRSVALTWFWVVLAVLLAVALPLWPYGKECGLQLFFYLGAAALTLLAGVAGAVSSWMSRRGFGHVLSLFVVVWAVVLGAREVLPRVGYAGEAKAWFCPATPEPAPQGTPPAAGN
jgi:hypothetical protein